MSAEVQPLKFSDDQKAAFKSQHAPYATKEQLDYFFLECERRALIPGKHVVFNLRRAEEWNPNAQAKVQTVKVALITTLEAARVVADRYSDAHPDRAYRGRSPFLYYYTDSSGTVGTGEKIPQGRRPHAVSVELKRLDWTDPVLVVARFDAFAQKTSGGELTKMWKERGEEQLAKCAEVAGLRAIAPEDLGGLYLREEMESILVDAPESGQAAPPPAAIVTPTVNQAPAKEESAKESAVIGHRHEATPVSAPVNTSVTSAPMAPIPAVLPPVTIFGPTPEPVKAGGLDFGAPAATPTPESRPTEEDKKDYLPDFFYQPAAAEEVAPAQPSTTATPEVPAVAVAPKPEGVPEKGTSVPAASTGRATKPPQYNDFMARATRVIHNLAAKNVYKGDSRIMASYLLKDTGKSNMLLLTPEEWETKLKTLESATLEAAAELLKGAKK